MNRTNIYNLKALDNALKTKVDEVSYVQVLSSIRFNFKEIEHLCFWDAEDSSKINICNGLNYELVLICWENNQQSQIHSHEGRESFTYVLKGQLTEDIYNESKKTSKPERSIVLNRRDISSLINKNDKEHRLTNSYGGRSVSLHLYIK